MFCHRYDIEGADMIRYRYYRYRRYIVDIFDTSTPLYCCYFVCAAHDLLAIAKFLVYGLVLVRVIHGTPLTKVKLGAISYISTQ